jgi:hypothetical protein
MREAITTGGADTERWLIERLGWLGSYAPLM